MAAYSLDAWRREFMGKRRMELAEEVLALFYQARDVIEQIRSPVRYLGEGQTREAAPDERGLSTRRHWIHQMQLQPFVGRVQLGRWS